MDREAIRRQIAFLELGIEEIQGDLKKVQSGDLYEHLCTRLAEKIAGLDTLRQQSHYFDQSAPLPPQPRQAHASSGVQVDNAHIVVGADKVDGDKVVGDKIVGDKVVGNKIVSYFFGGAASVDQKKLLSAYLRRVINDCDRLGLERLTEPYTGHDISDLPPLKLRNVFTTLATTHEVEFSLSRPVNIDRAKEWGRLRTAFHVAADAARAFDKDPTDPAFALRIRRPELLFETIAAQQRVVVLGDPGSGKSTAIRYLALLLAEAHLDQKNFLRQRGWRRVPTGRHLPIPVVCPLGSVAMAMTQARERSQPIDAVQAIWQVVTRIIEGTGGGEAGLGQIVYDTARRGALLLMFDGLDEIPVRDAQDQPLRDQIAAGIRTICSEIPEATVVVTSRILPYRDSVGHWQLRGDWTERTLAPFAFGQVRHFIRAWYAALKEREHERAAAAQQAARLIAALEENERVRKLTESPLLATMLTLVHRNSTENRLPADRADLYHRCVELLLDRWEPAHSWASHTPHPGLLERLDIPHLTTQNLRNELHALAYAAHRQPPTADGRGLLDADSLQGRLLVFFQRLKVPASEIVAKQQIVLRALQEESGLLHALSSDHYAFPHLTFQEYLAACYLADQPDLNKAAYAHWQTADRQHWREVLLLLMGHLRTQGLYRAVPWINRLLQRKLGTTAKTPEQLQRDVVLAAECYAEIGPVALASTSDDIEDLEQRLARALVKLLEVREPALPFGERLRAAKLLAPLGDTRYPVTLAQWRDEPRRTTFTANGTHYWRYVQAGTYRIGGWEAGAPASDIALPGFWAGRFPITVAQYAAFIKAGGYDHEAWWTPLGWQWRVKRKRTAPWAWTDSAYSQLNQPVVGVTWYEARAFCGWLTALLDDERLVVRLPSEAEWEALAAYDGVMQRRLYPWDEAKPTPELALYDEGKLTHPAAVGMCPGGMAAGGALDVVGNIWEWCQGWPDYPNQSGLANIDTSEALTSPEELHLSLRGSSYLDGITTLSCAMRRRSRLVVDINLGFRIILAPPL